MPSLHRWSNSSSIFNHSRICGSTTLSIKMSTTMITLSSPKSTQTSSASNPVLASPGLNDRRSSICDGITTPKGVFCPSTTVPATSTLTTDKSSDLITPSLSLPFISVRPYRPDSEPATTEESISYWTTKSWTFATGSISSSTSDQSTSVKVATTTFTSAGSTFTTIFTPGTISSSSVSPGQISILASNAANEVSQGNGSSGSDSTPSSIWIGSVTASVCAFLILIGIILCTWLPPPSRLP
jgi:hypothetical protein